mmetsp:Transcript_82498/g.237226  ORF Transcript_82498/g.237226 Transcript_82498/m.237226 type:complete len:190 (-) Transcript_82498:221-790(-)
MTSAPDLDFEVRWLPYQLNPAASEDPSSKTEMYMKKFGKTREQVQQMAQGMGEKFAAVGLPFRTEDGALVSNTFQAHRILTAAYQSGGPAAQDKAVEVIFNGYFKEGRAPNDHAMLEAAAAAAGLDGNAVLADNSSASAELKRELDLGRQIVDSGVPHFVFKNEQGKSVQFSGAHPPAQFLQAFAEVTK